MCDLNAYTNQNNDGLKNIEALAHQLKMPIPIPFSIHNKLHFRKKELNPIMLILISLAIQLKNVLTKNIWECFSIVNLILMIISKEYLIDKTTKSIRFICNPLYFLLMPLLLQIYNINLFLYLD